MGGGGGRRRGEEEGGGAGQRNQNADVQRKNQNDLPTHAAFHLGGKTNRFSNNVIDFHRVFLCVKKELCLPICCYSIKGGMLFMPKLSLHTALFCPSKQLELKW